MPPDQGRASQACTACRKQKTRCYASAAYRGPCLRCERTQQPCSLDSPMDEVLGNAGRFEHNLESSSNERLNQLERILQDVVARLDAIAPRESTATTSKGPAESLNDKLTRGLSNGTDGIAPTPNAVVETPGSVTSVAPVLVLRDVAREVGSEHRDENGVNNVRDSATFDLIDNYILTPEEVTSLLNIFMEHYGRWICLHESPTKEALDKIRKSPLLLCACCLIAVRHTTLEYALSLAPQLFKQAKLLLSSALLVAPQTIDFFQAVIILSLWSTTVGQALLSIDGWLISGFALQHASSNELFTHIAVATTSSLHEQERDRWLIWNHLCLVHLHYCVGTRRKASLDSKQIEICSKIIHLSELNNFETRMIAEIRLYWIIQESNAANSIDLPAVQARLGNWYQKWKFLFDQPRAQFIQMGYHFAQLLMYDQALKSRSAAVRESLLLEMVRLSAAILNLVMDTSDLRMPHLSDHIYHTISFAAVTLCRLLHMYEDQISVMHSVTELDQLILKLITWLRSIGLPCHIAHKLGDLVSAFHTKLRPNAKPTPTYTEAWDQFDMTTFPDQFGNDLFYFENGHFSPDWDPFAVQGSMF